MNQYASIVFEDNIYEPQLYQHTLILFLWSWAYPEIVWKEKIIFKKKSSIFFFLHFPLYLIFF